MNLEAQLYINIHHPQKMIYILENRIFHRDSFHVIRRDEFNSIFVFVKF